MNKRAVQNVRQAKTDQAKLEHLQVDEAEIAQLSQEAVDFFFCALSQDSVVDILRDVENKENAIGFGMAVTRPEFALDDPTSVSNYLFNIFRIRIRTFHVFTQITRNIFLAVHIKMEYNGITYAHTHTHACTHTCTHTHTHTHTHACTHTHTHTHTQIHTQTHTHTHHIHHTPI